MGDRVIGAKYAQALIEIAEKYTCLEAIHSDVEIISGILTENAGLRSVMSNPLVSAEGKKNIVDKISKEGSFNELTNNFLKLLIDEGRIYCITEILEIFESLYCQATSTQVATIKSAVILDEDYQLSIAKKIREISNAKNVKLKPIVDETLIGGFLIDMGSKLIDLSLKGALNRIEKKVVSAKM